MNDQVITISTQELFPVIEEMLSMGKQASFTIKGTSMLPFLGSNRDHVVLEKRDYSKLKRGDIILFQYETGKYILHRIYKVSDGKYLTIGDGNIDFDGWIEPEFVRGVVCKLIRKGREIDCNSKKWQLIFELWMRLLPIRGFLLDRYVGMSKIKRKLMKKR